MTLTQLLINYIIKHGADLEGTEVIFELECGCMVAREDAGDEFIPCDAHDVDSIANDGKELSDMAEAIIATVGQPLVETTNEDVFPDAPPALEESVEIMDYATEFVDDAVEITPVTELAAELATHVLEQNITGNVNDVVDGIMDELTGALEDLIAENVDAPTVEKTPSESLEDLVADDVEVHIDENTNEKDDEEMTIQLKSTRKKLEFAIATNNGMQTVSGYAVESNIDLPLGVHKVEGYNVWHVSELKSGSVLGADKTIKLAVAFAEEKLNRVGLDKVLQVIDTHLANQKPAVDETVVAESLEDLVDDAPMVDDEPVAETLEELVVEETAEPMTATEEINALANELLALTTKGASIATLMNAVRKNAGRIAELTTDGDVTPPTPPTTKVTPEPKKETKVTEQPKKETPAKPAPKKGASEASAFNKFKSAKILEAGTHSVKFEADNKQFIFLKNEAGKTLIRELGSNSNSYMTGRYLQSLIYDINTPMSRALFRKIKDIVNVKSPSKQVDGAASGASAKENNSTATNNPADTMTIKGIVIPKAWFNSYVADDKMTKKHGRSKMAADTIIAEFQAKK